MPNLVGIGNSQVPTNAMLGGLAYQDPAHANLTEVEIENIAAIKAKMSGTAVDVFVYDTRKDSDGGAWRHRTQNTSWYNEGASATRGARKEFPAVAVIVATTDTYTIYDGDDHNMSMWMVFKSDGSSGARIARAGTSAITMLNGLMCAVRSGSQRAAGFASFIDDTGYQINNSAKYLKIGGWDGLINRNVTGSFTGTDSSIATAGNGTYYDVAMAVLPNARIDDATGLPIPTIIIGNNGNTSIIRDNGTVADLTGFNPVAFVSIDGNSVVCATSGATSTHDFIFKANIPSQDEAFDARILAGSGNFYMNSSSGTTPLLRDLNMTAMSYNPSDGTVYRGGDNGFDIIAKTRTVSSSSNISLISYVDTDYNSGYMLGDIKGAFLASTDDTNISADSLQDNSHSTLDSTFATSTGWTVNADWTVSGGVATCDGQNNGRWIYPNTNTFPIGTIVAVEVTVSRTSGTLSISYGTGAATSGTEMTASGTYYHIGECTGNQIVYVRSDSFIGTIDNVKMYIAEADRSINKKGLAVVGTIEKHAVATGAELVGYRPNSSSQGTNYLRMPLSSSIFDLTSDWSINFWAKNNGNGNANYSGFEISPDDISSNTAYSTIPISMYIQGDGRLGLRGASVTGNDAGNNYILNVVDSWRCMHIVQRSGTLSLYIDGEFDSSTSATFANPGVAYSLNIFRWSYEVTRHDGRRHIDFSLFRMSETAPTEEQIKKMYDDEKLLFRENAKCTLYGSSSAVTALGFDDTNNTLHVGTSSGRSDFSGLTRINNTTTAVTTAISASNGLVAEQ